MNTTVCQPMTDEQYSQMEAELHAEREAQRPAVETLEQYVKQCLAALKLDVPVLVDGINESGQFDAPAVHLGSTALPQYANSAPPVVSIVQVDLEVKSFGRTSTTKAWKVYTYKPYSHYGTTCYDPAEYGDVQILNFLVAVEGVKAYCEQEMNRALGLC